MPEPLITLQRVQVYTEWTERGRKMREILFRGHDTESWRFGEFAYTTDGKTAITNTEEQLPLRFKTATVVDPDSVGQYTGFNDAQGNEIFEGDIISFPDWVTDEFGDFVPVKNIARVIFNTVSGAWEIEDPLHRRGSISPMLSLLPRDGLKVIGNMFENAEMLKGEAK